GDWPKIRLIGKSSLLTALAYGLLCCIAFVLFRRQLPLLFNDNGTVVALAGTLLLFASVFQISDATQAVNVGILRGIKDVKAPTLLVAVAYWIIGVPSGYFLAFHAGMGATGIWTGLIIGLSLVSISLTTRFLKLANRF